MCFLAGVPPALLPLVRESLCPSLSPPPHDHLLQAPESNPQQRSISISRYGESRGLLPHHATPHHANMPAQACSLPSHTLIDTVDLLCHLPEWRMGKSKFTLTFIFLNASIVLVLFLWLLPIYGHLHFLYVVTYFNAFFMGWPFSGILREIFHDVSQITSIF